MGFSYRAYKLAIVRAYIFALDRHNALDKLESAASRLAAQLIVREVQ
jgi:hypothetical protein